MGFKEDANFARYLSIGVYAAAHIEKDLQEHKHEIIELERYAKANKIWQIKVKRMRLPDLMCIRCGLRFESKGKSKLEVKLSDSDTENREWFSGGMREQDVFCFAQVDLEPADPTVGSVVYVTRQSLQDAYKSSKAGTRKSASQGSEVDRKWPMWVAPDAGKIIELSDRTVKVQYDSGRSYTYKGGEKWEAFYSLSKGARFLAGEPIATSFDLAVVSCAGRTWDWISDLRSSEDDIRFPAIKAARWLYSRDAESIRLLEVIAHDKEADWRVRLEALASLTHIQPYYLEELRLWALRDSFDLPVRMEAIFAISEIGTETARKVLYEIASNESIQNSEIRAAATWGIGLAGEQEIEKLLNLIESDDETVALHAAAQMPRVHSDEASRRYQNWLSSADLRLASCAIHLSVMADDIDFLVAALKGAGSDVERLILFAIGELPASRIADYETSLSEAQKAIVETIRSREKDWLRAPEREGALASLRKQSLRK